MNQKCAMCKSLLDGKVLSVMNCFSWFGVTNCAREIGRCIERPFGVQVSRVQVAFTSRYGQSGFYYQYRLNRTDYNAPGILLMEKYVESIEKRPYSPPVKRGPKILHVKQTHPKNAELKFENNTEVSNITTQ